MSIAFEAISNTDDEMTMQDRILKILGNESAIIEGPPSYEELGLYDLYEYE